MTSRRVTPKKLYKYRAFSELTVDMLVTDRVFFADPSTFNDPLDTQPIVSTARIEIDELRRTVAVLIRKRVVAEMTRAAHSIRYRGPRTFDHIQKLGDAEVDQRLAEIGYRATDPSYDGSVEENEEWLLGLALQDELLKQYDLGILCLAERHTCPLMWSHYGDQHKGLCIGYAVPEPAPDGLHKMTYGGSRLVEASEVALMLGGDSEAMSRVNRAVLLRKAGAWRYEKEWRMTGARGSQDSPLELSDVTFGFRCRESVKASVIKALEGRSHRIRFYEMREVAGTFQLRRFQVNEDELFVNYPRRARDATECFEDLCVEARS